MVLIITNKFSASLSGEALNLCFLFQFFSSFQVQNSLVFKQISYVMFFIDLGEYSIEISKLLKNICYKYNILILQFS